MNFGTPASLQLAVERKRPDFVAHPLGSNELERYTYSYLLVGP